MVTVAGIVVSELPVALVFDPVGLADHNLAAGIAVEPLVDRLSDRTEVIADRGSIDIQRSEYEAAIRFHARHLREVELGILCRILPIALGPWHPAQLAIV